jgi:sulfopyruvate decarboxylase TPP-binding subunit
MITFTKHGLRRMNQRGVTKEMIELTVKYGKYIQDKIILKIKEIKRLLPKVSQEIKNKLLKLLDKGGLVVVLSDYCSVITVYRRTSSFKGY